MSKNDKNTATHLHFVETIQHLDGRSMLYYHPLAHGTISKLHSLAVLFVDGCICYRCQRVYWIHSGCGLDEYVLLTFLLYDFCM